MASTTAQAQASRVCGLCSGVLWFNLPSEDVSSVPHHKSRKALEASAETCALCRMVLRAAISNYQVTDPKNRHWREYLKLKVQDGTGTRVLMCSRELGNHQPEHNPTDRPAVFFDTPIGPGLANGLEEQDAGPLVICPTYAGRRAGEEEELPNVGDLGIESPAEDLPVWIYGNYWRHSQPYEPGKDPTLCLVGIGARFATAHRPTDAFKCEPGYLSLRGSAIRICTSDGTFHHWTSTALRHNTTLIQRTDNALFGHIPGRLPEPRSDSELAHRRLAAWLDNCLKNHSLCKPPASDPKLPTRVIDISVAPGKAAVVESRGKTGKYVALSHTWGRSPRLTATRRNMNDLIRGVSVSFLPKTFQDAIEITRKLGIRYLWIDCLCIIQDDPQDWEREAPAMTHVYRNAHITISASASSDSHSGCFPARKGEAHVSLSMRSLGYDTPRVLSESAIHTMEYEHQSRPGLRNQIHLYDEWLPGSLSSNPQRDLIGFFGKRVDPVAEQPLSSRGWTLQERLLAPRVVHYAEDQIYFECEMEMRSECGFRAANTKFSLQHCLDTHRIPLEQHGVEKDRGLSLAPGRGTNLGGSPRQEGGWLSLVEEYSRRQLSVSQDKLSAIAGVARVISEETKDTYIAGVWASHLLEDIFWRVYTHVETFEDEGRDWNGRPVRGKLIGRSSVPTQYRAPSWSWASLDAPIKYIPLSYRNLIAKPRNCYATPSGTDKYGRVRDGLIDIEVCYGLLCRLFSPC